MLTEQAKKERILSQVFKGVLPYSRSDRRVVVKVDAFSDDQSFFYNGGVECGCNRVLDKCNLVAGWFYSVCNQTVRGDCWVCGAYFYPFHNWVIEILSVDFSGK